MNSLARFNHQPQLYLPHLEGIADKKPIIANPFDDEFEGYILDAKWTPTLEGIASYQLNTTKPSYIWGNFPATAAGTSNVIQLVQQTSVGTDLFSITLKCTIPIWEGYQGIYIYVYNADETSAVRLDYHAEINNDTDARLRTLTSGTWTNSDTVIKNYFNTVYLHIQRNASNVWWGWLSFTGGKGTWFEVGTGTKSITVDHIAIILGLSTTAGQTAFYGGPAGIDWVRKDWITL